MSKFVTRKWMEVNNLSSGQCSAKFKTSVSKSDLCYFSDDCIDVKGRIRSVRGTNAANRIHKSLIFKSNAPFKSYIWKINSTYIENPEDLALLWQWVIC